MICCYFCSVETPQRTPSGVPMCRACMRREFGTISYAALEENDDEPQWIPVSNAFDAMLKRARELQGDFDTGRVMVGVDWSDCGGISLGFKGGGRTFVGHATQAARRALASIREREDIQRWEYLLGIDHQAPMLATDESDDAFRDRVFEKLRREFNGKHYDERMRQAIIDRTVELLRGRMDEHEAAERRAEEERARLYATMPVMQITREQIAREFDLELPDHEVWVLPIAAPKKDES